MVLFEQSAQAIAVEHIDADTVDAADRRFTPAAGDYLRARIAQHFGGGETDTRRTAEYDCLFS